MNIKNNKGVTLIVLTITIIVLLIIAGITIYTGSKLIQEAKLEDVKTNMLLVQAETKKYVEQAKFEKKTMENLVSEGVTVDGVTFNIAEAKTVNEKKYYKITTSMIDLNLSKINPEYYLVEINIDEIGVDVYFVPGITDGENNAYHLLSEMP